MAGIPVIDESSCTMCGQCVEICPLDVLEHRDGFIVPTVEECMLCSHCMCVCPVDAVSFDRDVLRGPEFSTFEYKDRFMEKGDCGPHTLVDFVRSRRSVRRYRPDPVPGEVIQDLIEFGITAPSGSNCQDWEFTVLGSREKVWGLALDIRDFFLSINRMARNPLIRYGSVLIMGRALLRYYRDHMATVEMALEQGEKGRDLLFHGAPALIIVHSSMEGSTPVEDAQFASYNIALLAHALGLGTCHIGYAVDSINRTGRLKGRLGIPAGHRVHSVMTLGYTDTEFTRPALRKPARVHWR